MSYIQYLYPGDYYVPTIAGGLPAGGLPGSTGFVAGFVVGAVVVTAG